MLRSMINEIDSAQLNEMLQDGSEQVHLIDVRSLKEIAMGAIAGADHLPLHLLPSHLDRIPEDKKVIFYCRSGARSAQACLFAMQHGVDNVYNLRGGIIAWARSGLSISHQ